MSTRPGRPPRLSWPDMDRKSLPLRGAIAWAPFAAIVAAAAIASPLLLDPYSAALSQLPAAALALGVWLLLLRGGGTLSAWGAAVLAAAAWYLRGESLVTVPFWIWAASSGGRPRRGAIF